MANGKKTVGSSNHLMPGSATRPHVLGPGVVAVRFGVDEFATPPVRDALVLGKRSPVESMTLRKALAFLHTAPFVHIEMEDDIIGDIVDRKSIVRIIGREKLIKLAMELVKPLMTDVDILHLNIVARLHMEAEV